MARNHASWLLFIYLGGCGIGEEDSIGHVATTAATQPLSLAPLRIPNPVPNSEDYFASSARTMSFDPKADRIAIGVPSADVSGIRDTGVVYLIQPSTGTLFATLQNPEPAESANFGTALTFHDGGLVVGAPGADRGFGKIYQFDTTGTFKRTIENPNRGAPVAPPYNNDSFGNEVLSLSGSRLLVGAPFTDCGNGDAGAVYLLDTRKTAPVLRRIDSPVCPGGFSWFGFGLAKGASGRVMIGAPIDGVTAKHGAVYIYDSSTFTVLRKIDNPEPGTYDYFGSTNMELGGRLYIAAPTDDLPGVSGTDHGRVFVYDAATGTFLREMRDPAPNSYDHYGSSLAAIGQQVLVGSSAWLKIGSVQVYDSAGLLVHTIHNPAGVTTFFGQAIKTKGETLMVAAPNESYNGKTYVGALYRY